MRECLIERREGDRAQLVTSHPAAPGEDLVLQFDGLSGASTSYAVRVESCTPRGGDGPQRFTLHVTVSAVLPERHRVPASNV